jgi:hypothetical protein
MTRETVFFETCARRATSLIVGRFFLCAGSVADVPGVRPRDAAPFFDGIASPSYRKVAKFKA